MTDETRLGQSDDSPYRLYGHAYALLDHLRRCEKHPDGHEGYEAPTYRLEEGQRAPELVEAGLLAEGEKPARVKLTESGRGEADKGHPGSEGRDVAPPKPLVGADDQLTPRGRA